MARGFIRGVLWGTGVSLGVVTLVSVAGDGPQPVEWRSAESVAPAKDKGSSTETIGSSGNRIALTGAETGIRNAPLPDTLGNIAAEAFDPADIPETGLASHLPLAGLPETSAQEGLAATDTSAPLVTATIQRALTTPATEPDVSISTEPAQPPAPSAEQQSTAFADIDPVGQADEPAGQLLSPTVQNAEAATDPVQPITPVLPESSAVFADVETEDEARPLDSGDIAGVASVAVDNLDTESGSNETAEAQPPVVMADAPDVLKMDGTGSAPLASDDAAVAEPEQQAAQDVAFADLPQPQATTVVEDLAEPSEGRSAALPQITAETEAPLVETATVLQLPQNESEKSSVVDKTSAEVVASVNLGTAVQTPDAPTPAMTLPAREESEGPDFVVAPDIVLASVPDGAVIADITTIPPVNTLPSSTAIVTPVREVKVNRLPTLGNSIDETTETAPQQPGTTTQEAERPDSASVPPVRRFAQPFENPENKPPMAIVLIDDGVALDQNAIGLPALRELPYPISFAIDADLPDAQARMQTYRSEGFEVLAMVNFPQGATAKDAEVNLSVALDRMPEVVGVLEGLTTGVQTSRDSGPQVAAILAQTGHGFVTQNKGLNTVQKLAARQGVPSGVVFRDFDAQDQSARVISRFLDQAAFRAGQEGGVIMLGRMREETMAALMLWALQDRASQVALAPVSGALRTQEQ